MHTITVRILVLFDRIWSDLIIIKSTFIFLISYHLILDWIKFYTVLSLGVKAIGCFFKFINYFLNSVTNDKKTATN
jgi:hypothetical protein